MRIAVVGGTGLAGRHVVDAVRALGHHPVVIARSTGFDVLAGTGLSLEEAFRDVDAVIDTTNTPETDGEAAQDFFGTVTENLLAAEERAGVACHVVLSIIGIDRVQSNGHYASKRRQEQLVADGPVPFTIQRTSQFFEFADMVVGWTRHDGAAVVPPLLIQPVALTDVARVLARAAASRPLSRVPDLAGPEPQDLVDMARRSLAAHGESLRLVPSWRDGPFGTDMAGDVLLPGPDARLAPTVFDSWLAEQAEKRAVAAQ